VSAEVRGDNGVVSEQPGRYERSTAGMVGAMIVLVAVVVGFVVLRGLNRDDAATPVRSVDYHQAADYARKQASFDLVAPVSLPPGWRATTVEYVPGSEDRWHLGLLTDADRYVGLEQSDDSVRTMVTTYVDTQARKGSTTTVAGRSWTTYTDDRGDLALVRREHGATTLVVGHLVPRDELTAFVASLR
jgi:hypothetical protein